MTNEETFIQQELGKRNPFKVPEGYFEQLGDRVMASLPECREDSKPVRKPLLVVLRPWVYAAACATLLLVVGVGLLNRQPVSVPIAQQQEKSSGDQITEEESFEIMYDNADIYAYLSD